MGSCSEVLTLLPSAPGVASNITLDLWIGSNSMWAVNSCFGPSAKQRSNTNRSAPFNPRWAPPFAPGCARRIALGGLSFGLPGRGRVSMTMEQHIGQPRLQAVVSSEMGRFTLVAYLHPLENIVVVFDQAIYCKAQQIRWKNILYQDFSQTFQDLKRSILYHTSIKKTRAP